MMARAITVISAKFHQSCMNSHPNPIRFNEISIQNMNNNVSSVICKVKIAVSLLLIISSMAKYTTTSNV